MKLLQDVGRITGYDYEPQEGETLEDKLYVAVEDLLKEYDDKCDELDDYKSYVDDHYRPLSLAEELGVCPY